MAVRQKHSSRAAVKLVREGSETSNGPAGETSPKKASAKRANKITPTSTHTPKKRKARAAGASMRLVQNSSAPSLEDLLSGPAFCPEPTPEAADPGLLAKVEGAVRGLGKLESEIIAALFPPIGCAPESMESLAKRLGMSLEEIKGIADGALRGLRGTRGSGNRMSTVWN
jgi:hypothetical protein